MGLLNKIKGIFVEEVYEDEEDEEFKNAKERLKAKDSERIQVAKKIENPSTREKEETKEDIINESDIHEDDEDDNEETKEFQRKDPFEEPEFKFPMQFDDKDFQQTGELNLDDIKEEEKIEEKYEEHEVQEEKEEIEEQPILYHERRVDREVTYSAYQIEPEKKEPYEASNNKKGFQRSPIISPVYGILDKNYRKEEIVSKKEIRLMTNNQKADLDLVREKAYGELASDITESLYEKVDKKEEKKEKEEEKDVVYDLSDDTSPNVKDVTVGDAEEYFNDLGLEYNVDYKVVEEEPSVKADKIDTEEEKKEEPKEDKKEEAEEDNLFDLIDAMYESK